MSLPAALAQALAERFGSAPAQTESLGRTKARAVLAGQSVIVKWAWPDDAAAAPDPCTAEARGLTLLAGTASLRIPHVHAHEPAIGAVPAFLVVEWVDSSPRHRERSAATILGQQLAALHRHTAPAYGLDHDNYCGPTPQRNTWVASWIDFYRDHRLRPQIARALAAGLLPWARHQHLERLLDRLDTWLDPRPEPPSLIHGDLWGGNWLADVAGQPVLIDPAVSYSHREAELAMCRLFGGFPAEFWAAYDDALPPLPGRDERQPLYQLYHLLNHLNLFGESYGTEIDLILRRYVG